MVNTDPIIQFDDELTLVRAMEANLLETLDYLLANWDKTTFERTPQLLWSITDTQFTLFNSIIGARLTDDTVDATIQSLIERGKEKEVPILWWLGIEDTPENLGKKLLEHGFFTGNPTPGMAMKMSDITWTELPENLTIVPVRTAEQAQIWSDLVVESNQMAGYNEELAETLISGGLDASAKMQHIIGLLDDEPVATASVTLSNGVAGVFNIAVLPDMRQQGIGRIMTETVMKIGTEQGYHYAVLQSSPMGEALYQKMGYETIAPVHQYIWLPSEQ